MTKNNKYTKDEIDLLKKWSDIAKNYSLLHDRACLEYQNKNYKMAIPIIIMSTLSGTASFSIGHFPIEYQRYVPLAIGGINIFVGILQTLIQFFKINELIGEHKSASIEFDKYSRNIITELVLPEEERTYSGTEFVNICKKEIDKIIEHCPSIPLRIINNLDNIIKSDLISNYSGKNMFIVNNNNNVIDLIKKDLKNIIPVQKKDDSKPSFFYEKILKRIEEKNDNNKNLGEELSEAIIENTKNLSKDLSIDKENTITLSKFDMINEVNYKDNEINLSNSNLDKDKDVLSGILVNDYQNNIMNLSSDDKYNNLYNNIV